MSFISSLKESKIAAQTSMDPWLLRLEGMRGKKWDDGIERISSRNIFDFLEIPQKSRGAGAGRRLSKLMRELGWSQIKARGLSSNGLREQVRGYSRDLTNRTIF